MVARTPGRRRPVVWIYDLASGAEVREVALPSTAAPTAIAWSPGGRAIAAASWDGAIALVDPETGAVRVLAGGPQAPDAKDGPAPVSALAFSPGGRRLASGGRDGVVVLWDVG